MASKPAPATELAAASAQVVPDQVVPAEAVAVFGGQVSLAARYAQLLIGPGIERGLLGPRESERIWARHLLNCAALTELLPVDARVVDVGSGAGLPGLVLAIRRPDLRVDLVESLRRRTDFLTEMVAELDLGDRVRVVHGRVEDQSVRTTVGEAEWVTARALAPLDRLVRWCLPLLRPGGALLAVKGAQADAELARCADAVRLAGGVAARVIQCAARSDGPSKQAVPGTEVSVVVVRRGSDGTARRPDGRGTR